ALGHELSRRRGVDVVGRVFVAIAVLQSGSWRIASPAARRMIQLRQLISTGWQEPDDPIIRSGYISAHIKLCMQLRELPMTRRRWASLSPSVTSRRALSTMS